MKAFCKILLFAGLPFLASCFKKDTPVVLPPAGDAKVYSVAIGSDYATQAYFHLSDGATASNPFDEWDLCMEASITGYHVWMNGGNSALIANTHQTDFSLVPDTASLSLHYEAPGYNPDSTMIGEYMQSGVSSPSLKEVYVIRRTNYAAPTERWKKFVLLGTNDANYFIKFSNLDGSEADSIYVTKNPQYAYLYFTFSNAGQQLNLEPLKNSWDLLFTRYRVIFYSQTPPLPYLVNGVLVNPGTKVAKDSTHNFDAVDLALAQSETYSSQIDFIGYGWKYFDFATQTYLTRSNYIYLILDRNGVYWKLHFVDFYNDQGQKGYPKFELKRL